MKMRDLVVVGCLVLVAGACGGDGETSNGADSSGAPSGDCPTHGFSGTATRTADEGFGHAEGSYTGADFVDARSDITSGRSGSVYLASFELPESLLMEPTVEPGEVMMRIYAEELDTMVAGDQWEITASRRVPLINNGGSNGNNIDGAAGTITVIAITDADICYEIEYSDEFQEISGTVSAPWEG